MPRKKKVVTGQGLENYLSIVNKILKKTKILGKISTVAKGVEAFKNRKAGPSTVVNAANSAISSLGYGRKKRVKKKK